MKEEQSKSIRKFIEMLKDARVCMLITSEKGVENLSRRPMAATKIDEDGTMWFFTKKSSHKVNEFERGKNISIAITNSESDNYLIIHGTGNLLDDKAKMKELWNPIMKTWFPLGLEDEDMILIKVIPNEVNYWDISLGKMVVLFNRLKTIVITKEYKKGEHVEINLQKNVNDVTI